MRRLPSMLLTSSMVVSSRSGVLLTTTTTKAAVISGTANKRQFGCLGVTPMLYKDVRRGDRGESRRLTFEERAERRMGKSKEEKMNKQMLIQEAEILVNEDYPAELEDLYTSVAEKSNMAAMKVLNMAKCLELLDVDMSSGHGSGQGAQQQQQHKLLLAKVAQVVKTSPTSVEITPSSNSFASPILHRVSRFDGSLQVTKEGNVIKVVMPPVTTAQRDKAVQEIKHLISHLKNKTKQSRNNAGRVLQECGLEEQAQTELIQFLDSTTNSFLDEKCIELDLLAEEVMSMGIDESDNAV